MGITCKSQTQIPSRLSDRYKTTLSLSMFQIINQLHSVCGLCHLRAPSRLAPVLMFEEAISLCHGRLRRMASCKRNSKVARLVGNHIASLLRLFIISFAPLSLWLLSQDHVGRSLRAAAQR